ncbi:mechanosensitive ion channel-like protein [Saccharopolyspora erythraea NRRL 2338]|uniref:Mechanosensitive ion channel MscS domain-containing protein n=1 Tax=Saccharopolyspora erythraea TaxID=1836 RepID=A0ABN1EAV7_SACER|nr:mechanosensitive ion channel family protein [Saccharopolyspora erythraea]EQD82923.1 small mechanosensitive ion channel protein MscS [Saccharopolyspora erythraea D]PFG98214.1 mechanosensitive ion channel-like protein [Saccharopolyspora erythraea NRRL 2338]QRK88312.1 mechanosensitive ion channel family protein [Saccharopolyspora erythraea]
MASPNEDPGTGRRGWWRAPRLKPRRPSADVKRGAVASALAVAMIVAAAVVDPAALFRHGSALYKTAAIAGAIVFVVLGAVAVQSLAREAGRRTRVRLSPSHAGALRLVVSLAGYALVAVVALGELGVRVDQLLLGGAVTGVIIGIAAQQSLGNVFAGLMLVTARPFTLGDHLVIHSGTLGGPLQGRVTEMGLVYLTLESDEGPVKLPNTAVLNSAIAPNNKIDPAQSGQNNGLGSEQTPAGWKTA